MEHVNDDIVREGFLIAHHFYTGKFIDEIITQLDRYNALQYNKQIRSGFVEPLKLRGWLEKIAYFGGRQQALDVGGSYSYECNKN